MDIKKLEEVLTGLGEPGFRMKQIKKAVFQDGVSAFSEISTLTKKLRELLEEKISILPFEIAKIAATKDGQSAKALLKLKDDNFIETVLISTKPSFWSACISTQVGCAMGCRFCATGKMGFGRNLTAEEITSQVLFWRQYLKTKNHKLNSVVYMGMGEPFLNWKETKQSLKDLADPELFGLGARNVSVSTSGITEKIEEFGREFPQTNLAISLHFADDKKRMEFMPVNNKYNLEKLGEALRNYFKNSNRKVFIEYIMLADVNDNEKDAEKLAKFLKTIGKEKLLHVNLICYNTTSENLKPSPEGRVKKFKHYLLRNKINATIRKSLGEEIQGACGQLAGKV